jgi:hypothetical protein
MLSSNSAFIAASLGGIQRRRPVEKVLSVVVVGSMVVGLTQFGVAQTQKWAERSAVNPIRTAVESATSTATVAAIDYPNRTGSIRLANGTILTFKAGPEARDFDQLKVGDQVLIRK